MQLNSGCEDQTFVKDYIQTKKQTTRQTEKRWITLERQSKLSQEWYFSTRGHYKIDVLFTHRMIQTPNEESKKEGTF